jgi:hypothetical protein
LEIEKNIKKIEKNRNLEFLKILFVGCVVFQVSIGQKFAGIPVESILGEHAEHIEPINRNYHKQVSLGSSMFITTLMLVFFPFE